LKILQYKSVCDRKIMEVHICIFSTMTPVATAACLKLSDLYFDAQLPSFQRFRWTRPSSLAVSVWVVCQHPLTNELLNSTIPYMDACICLYHDHSPVSCLRVRKAMSLLEPLTDAIWLMSTTVPRSRLTHQSKIRKFYDKNGFERSLLTGTLRENIEKLIEVDLKLLKHI
jgi:hypothetical protein